MLRKVLAVVLLLLSAGTAAGQEGGGAGRPACRLTLAEAPDVKGLRLGLPMQNVFQLFPGSADDKDVRAALAAAVQRFGAADFTIKPAFYADNSAYDGVTSVSVKFVDGRLSAFNVGFDSPEWPHVDDFLAKLTEGTSLPPADAWSAHVGLDTQLKNLTCEGFEVSVFAGGKNLKHNYVRMKGTAADRLWRERREKARQSAPAP
jgi:hypothetical protein